MGIWDYKCNDGYARCVDSFEHFIEYSFELFNPKIARTLFSKDEKAYTISRNTPPASYGEHAEVKESFIAIISKKQIKINFRAIMLDNECFNYVLIHELSHLKEFNHSKKFWNIVKKFEPKYDIYRKKLKDYGFLLEMYR